MATAALNFGSFLFQFTLPHIQFIRLNEFPEQNMENLFILGIMYGWREGRH